MIVPDEEGREPVHRVIYEELTMNRVEDSSRAAFRHVITALARRGAEGIVLGCTEITLLVGPADSPVPVFDSTRIRVQHALDTASR